MPESEPTRIANRANRLYWETERAAAEVAKELGISRSKLYALVRPIPTEQPCAECGAILIYSNRTEREARRGRCPECGATADIELPAAASPGSRTESRTDRPAIQEPLASTSAASSLLVGAGVGLAAGFLAGAWFRRKR